MSSPISERTAVRTASVSLVLAGLAMVGCAAPPAMYAVAKEQAPAALGCPSEQVAQYNHAGNHHLTFRGCGRYVVYHCMWSSAGGAQCVPEDVGRL